MYFSKFLRLQVHNGGKRKMSPPPLKLDLGCQRYPTTAAPPIILDFISLCQITKNRIVHKRLQSFIYYNTYIPFILLYVILFLTEPEPFSKISIAETMLSP